MAGFKVKIDTDQATGLIYASIYSDRTGELIVQGEPRYHSVEQAERDVADIFRKAWPHVSIKAERIG